MNYRHLFHAGNFADVIKHIVLIRLLQALARKEKGFTYMETHAGAGYYDLHAPDAQKSGEFREGITRLWNGPVAPEWRDYLHAVRNANPSGELRYYPGSPRIARQYLRSQDRMLLAEQLPPVCAQLQQEFAGDRDVRVQCVDGYAALKSWLPPPQRRGLVFIDPPYEGNDEWERAGAALGAAVDRWSGGVYALWYPLKPTVPVGRLKSLLTTSSATKVLEIETYVWPADTPFRLNGCGMLIVNPPWQIDVELKPGLSAVVERLKQGPEANVSFRWLVDEKRNA